MNCRGHRALLCTLFVCAPMLVACAPPPEPEGEVGCEPGDVVVAAVGLQDGDSLVLTGDGEGFFEATVDVLIDGIDSDDEIASVSVSVLATPRPPSDAAPGDDGQTCVVQGAAYTCDGFLRCIDEVCRLVVADRTLPAVEPTCGDDHALHLEEVVLPITQQYDVTDMDGFEVELRVAVERAGQRFVTGAATLVLDVE